ncbi:MAG: membrane dipeptidase [Gemmatimonadetes bacterium]|nr:dipeptidase [Gemmatimonadota bacterium]NNM06093.1 membrane dipeptidase [Gemmatimonadota bacterium]
MPGSKRLLLALMVLGFPSPGWSQDLSTEMPVGSRIRVNIHGQETIGRLRVLWTDSLEMGPDGGLAPMKVRFSNIDRLEVSMGSPARSRREAVIGGLIGGAFGGLTFNIVARKYSDDGSALALPLGALIGGVSGVLFGGTVGDAASRETWRVLPVGRRDDPRLRAVDLARSAIIVDGHLDVPNRLQARWEDVSEATTYGNFDYPRAVAGGLDAPFMAIYTPSDLEAEGLAKERADELIDIVWDIIFRAPGRFNAALSANAVRSNRFEGAISLPMGMENGAPLEGDLANLRYFYGRGIRYIGLTHNASNHIADSSRDDPRWDGLSPFGEEVVREMNRLGMMVDVSHISDAAFWDVMEVSKAPVIASHSGARHFTPGWPRNLSDEMIRALADGGGLVMINFGSSFLTQEANAYRYGRRDAYRTSIADRGLEPTEELEAEFNEAWAAEYGPFPFASIDDVLDQIDHIVDLVGIDHVGIGSDFDGVGDTLPIGLKDVSTYPNLIRGLFERGYSEVEIRQILGENLLRVWANVDRLRERTGRTRAPR